MFTVHTDIFATWTDESTYEFGACKYAFFCIDCYSTARMYQLIAHDRLNWSLLHISCSNMQCLLSIQPRLGSCPLWLRTISPHSPVLSIVLLLKLLVSLLIFFGSVFLQFLLLHSVVELTAIRGRRRTHPLLDILH